MHTTRPESPAPAEDPIRLRCYEIWGGNRAIENALSLPGLDAWVSSEPHGGDDGGGDVHYVSMCAGGRVARFVVADVSGHGRGVEAFAERLRDQMRRHMGRADQTKITRALNADFARTTGDEIFATAVLATYLASSERLILVNAGHPPPLIYRASEDRWSPLVEGEVLGKGLFNLPLGVIEPTDYHQFAVTLRAGDRVLLYTDSLIEARSPGGEMLQEAGLVSIANGLAGEPAATFVPRLLDRVAAHRGGSAPQDDTTAVLLCHNAGAGRRLGFGERLAGIGRLMGVGESGRDI